MSKRGQNCSGLVVIGRGQGNSRNMLEMNGKKKGNNSETVYKLESTTNLN